MDGLMPDEPVYTFHKGLGWLPGVSSDRSPIFTLKTGERGYFEFRKPEAGDYYDCAYNGDGNNNKWFIDGFPVWDKWVESYASVMLPDLSSWEAGWRHIQYMSYVVVHILPAE